ncbi:MAG: phenylalanine--tRNA ligase subunit alpha [Aerococcus sp.]|nr:phenylalanine--tRNA ligase subunit alpha [Aerococcus sp.]
MAVMEQLEQIQSELNREIEAATTVEELRAVRVKYLGKKGPITEALRGLRDADPEERPKLGQKANQLKQAADEAIKAKEARYEQEALEKQLASEVIDVSLPGKTQKLGYKHVLRQVINEIEDLFLAMGYQIKRGPEIETDYYNFKRMNIPDNHPARDMQDSFYLEDEYLLRTHTSPVEARTMDQHDFSKGPLKMISPGKVYRRDDDDATHSHQFMQIEGLAVGKGLGMSDLKGTLEVFARHMFGQDREIRLRPSYFPFTEPSAEIDISCFNCGGKGCSICKYTGWIEVLGGGMTHPNVLEMSRLDPNEYTAFAFGLGPDRIAMLKYGIDDIRHFYQNDLRFNHQFKERG